MLIILMAENPREKQQHSLIYDNRCDNAVNPPEIEQRDGDYKSCRDTPHRSVGKAAQRRYSLQNSLLAVYQTVEHQYARKQYEIPRSGIRTECEIAQQRGNCNHHRRAEYAYEPRPPLYDGNHIHFNQPAIDPENMLYAFSPQRIYAQRGYKLEGMDTFAIFRDVKKKHAEQEAQAQQRELFTKDLLQLGFMGNTPELLNAQVLELLKIQNQLIQQSLEQQKLAMLNQHPELLQQVVKNNAPQIDNKVMLQISSKLNERERA